MIQEVTAIKELINNSGGIVIEKGKEYTIRENLSYGYKLVGVYGIYDKTTFTEPQSEDERELETLQAMQADSNRWMSQEEFDRLKELSTKSDLKKQA